jgi:hypothetical protein
MHLLVIGGGVFLGAAIIDSALARGHVDCGRAVAAGLVTRPLAETVDAALDEFATLVADDPRRAGKMTPARERELIEGWRRRAASADGAAAAAVADDRTPR